jgi:Zn-dependent protease
MPEERASPKGSVAERRRPASSLRIARLLGVDVYIHWTFLFILLLVFAIDQGGGGSALLGGLEWIVAIFGSVLVHELAHCVVAQHDGVVVDDILLLPIGGVSEMRSIPKIPKEELAIAVVGPLTSLALAVVFAVLAVATGARIWPPTLLAGSWLARLAWLNLLLGLFNLLPALPMDGGRVLRAGLAMHEDRRTATVQAAKVARVLAYAMIAVGLVWDFWFIFIGVFVLLGAGAEEREETSKGGPPPGR